MTTPHSTPETRLSVRLAGPLAAHVNRQVESALYNSHSEYIRDLVRRDMAAAGEHATDEDRELEASLMRGLSDLEHGRYEKWDSKKSLADVKAYAAARRKQ